MEIYILRKKQAKAIKIQERVKLLKNCYKNNLKKRAVKKTFNALKLPAQFLFKFHDFCDFLFMSKLVQFLQKMLACFE